MLSVHVSEDQSQCDATLRAEQVCTFRVACIGTNRDEIFSTSLFRGSEVWLRRARGSEHPPLRPLEAAVRAVKKHSESRKIYLI